jgi:two-component system cell cycle sensor histidine kinase/response regulator CckA
MTMNGDSFRQEAEEILENNPAETPAMPTMDIQELLRELRIHEAALEAQNEQLLDAERELTAARDRYAELFNCAPTGYLTIDRSGTIMDANTNTAALFGTAREQLTKQHHFEEFVASEDLDEWNRFQRDVFETRGTRHCELTLKRNGTVRWGAHMEGCVLNAEPGNDHICMIDLSDITSRQRAEQALQVSEARYRSIFESIQDVYVEVALNGTIIEVSPSIEAFLGYTREEALGLTFADFCVHTEQMNALLNRLREEGKFNNHEIVLRSKARADITCSFSAKVINDAGGKPFKFAGTMRDMTEIKRLENEQEALEAHLRQAQKMEAVGQLAGGLAHNFNNLLMSMMGYVDLCSEELPVGHTAHQWLDEISHDAQRSTDLIRQVLAFARKQTIDPKVLDVNAIVTKVLNMLSRLIGENIEIIWQPREDVWPIRADASQIELILANLSTNARDAIQGVGQIHITTSNTTCDDVYCAQHADAELGEYVMVEFRDSGCGIDPKMLEHVFEPFYTTKGMGTGTGMGLSSVLGIVKQHGGFLEVASEQENGTAFRIFFPRELTQEGLVSQTSAAPSTIPKGQGVVLLVDDSEAICKTTRILLERMGYTALVAQSSQEAQRLSAEHIGRIDILLTDVIMPVMNGTDLADALTQTRPDMKTVFMSGYPDDITTRARIERGTVEFLAKPFSRAELAQTLHAMRGA